jgi:dsRNA-specific ribonuclease
MSSNFEEFILNWLNLFPLSQRVKQYLGENVSMYKEAFNYNDYQVYEQIGDSIIGQFIITYSYRKFPFLNNKEGVKIVARIRIKYTSSQFLARLAHDLSYFKYIVAPDMDTLSEIKKQALLEDVFEAVIGLTNVLVDKEFGAGTGYIVCYAILTTLYNTVNIDITYENLFDSKTRLKELCDVHKNRISVQWNFEKLDNNMISVVLSCTIDNQKYTLSSISRTKIDAEQEAASNALDLLKKIDIVKTEPEIFTQIRCILHSKN